MMHVRSCCFAYETYNCTVLRFFPFLLTSPLSLLKLFTITVGYILHHIVLDLNVSSVRGFTQMGGVFFYPFFKATLFKVVVLAE